MALSRKPIAGKQDNNIQRVYSDGTEAKPENIAQNLYTTPLPVVKGCLAQLVEGVFDGIILDIGCAENPVWAVEAQRRAAKVGLTPYVGGVEYREIDRPDCLDFFFQGSFMDYQPINFMDLQISNPPFDLIEEMVEHAFDIAAPYGTIGMLAKAQFYGSTGRYAGFWKKFPLYRFHYCVRRIPFLRDPKTGRLKSEPFDYAFFEWKRNYTGREATIRQWDWLDYGTIK